MSETKEKGWKGQADLASKSKQEREASDGLDGRQTGRVVSVSAFRSGRGQGDEEWPVHNRTLQVADPPRISIGQSGLKEPLGNLESRPASSAWSPAMFCDGEFREFR